MGLNDNTLNKEQTQKRILLATLLSFAFFVAYDFLYVQPKQQLAQQQTTQAQQTQNNKISKISPQSTVATTQQAPSNKTTSNIADETKIVTTIQTLKNTFLIDNLGRISQVVLKDKQYITKDGSKIKLFSSNQLKPLEVRFANNKINEEAFKTDVQVSTSNIDATTKTQTLTITQKLSSTTLIKKLVFYPNGHYDITINTTNEQNFFVSTGYRPDVLVDVYSSYSTLFWFSLDVRLNHSP
jgi:YidC/Oxa1 family membrane protein insertase